MSPMTQVNVHQAKTHFSRLLDRAHAGEEILIAKNGEPYARLVPLEKPKRREPGMLKGKLEESFFDPLPEEELEAWEP
jgi:prevent-host-death family protein